ncbi:MAG: Uma2 family endonuclease [Cyanobacteria bacterium P01_G01_bin.54]
MTAIVLNLDTVDLTDDQFFRLCQVNRDWQLERNAQGELIIMAPVGGISGNREADLITDLNLWNRQTGLGKVFSSSTTFRLPRGGDRSPDAAWVSQAKWNALSLEEQEKFPPLCPEFVIELRSRTDALPPLRAKMQEYLTSGLQLGWLINPQDQQVEVYQPSQPKQIVSLPTQLSGDPVLAGFTLTLGT